MKDEQQDKIKYPIGQFKYGKSYSLDDTRKHIKALAKFPKELKKAIKKLKGGELDKAYRPDGWTVRQVVHHLVDSHMNAYVRIKLAVTENTPIIKPYEEKSWAELEDAKHGPIKASVKMLDALHERWTDFLKSLEVDDLEKGYYHPASKKTVLLQEAIALYVWHSQHHLGHIMLVVKGKNKGIKAQKAVTEKSSASEDKPKTAKPPQAPKKRTISAEHREKIRAAQVARHAGKAAEPSATSETAAPAKRGRKPGAKAAAAKATSETAAPAKRGRKPGAKAAAASTTSETAAPAKRGRKPGVKAAATDAAPEKRTRRSKAEMEALRSGETKVVSTAPVKAKAVKAPKVAKPAKAPAVNADGTPKRRGLSPERMAEIRAMRGDKKAAKPAKAPALNADGTPKRRGLSPERMAEIRAMRGNKK